MKYFVILFFLFISHSHALSDLQAIQKCLKNFGEHPFNKDEPKFRSITPSVKVFGIGSSVVDNEKTKNPELVLVKSAVSVLSKTTYQLLNPNGWYCLNGKVAVLAKTVIQLDCSAKLAATNSSVTILGSDKDQTRGGVTVLGKTEVQKVNCKEKAD